MLCTGAEALALFAAVADMVGGAFSNHDNLKQLSEQVAGVMDTILRAHATLEDGPDGKCYKAKPSGRYVHLQTQLKDLLEVRSTANSNKFALRIPQSCNPELQRSTMKYCSHFHYCHILGTVMPAATFGGQCLHRQP